MATDSGYAKRDFLRVCDICGHRFHFSQLKPIGELKFACPDDAPGLTALQISRFNARARPLVVRPNKHAKPLTHTPIYQLAEAQIFNFIAATAPAETKDGSPTSLGAAWSAIYMADVVNQDKRPAIWEATARQVIATCCTYLLTRQFGSPTGFSPSGAITDVRYGGITDDTPTGDEFTTAVWSTPKTIAAGLAFIKAYQATGTAAYLAAANRCATYIRHVQSGNLQVTGYTTYPSGGGRYRVGGLAAAVRDNGGIMYDTYYLADVGAAWFLALLGAVVGTSAVYGDAAATAALVSASSGTIAEMIAELTTFATVGPRDSTNNGNLTPPLSTTAPRVIYTAATQGANGTASWADVTTVPSDDISMALLGLYMANGTTAIVTQMMAWLQAFASNADNRTPTDIPESQVLVGITGTYDSTLCPADTLTAAAPFTEADGALYSWSSLGLLSPIIAATDAAGLRRAKDQLSKKQRFLPDDNYELYLGPIGSSGLSFQPFYRDAFGRLVSAGGGVGAAGAAAELTPPSGMWLWLKADVGITKDADNFISMWADQSGHGRGPTTAAISGPLFVASGIDSQPSVAFDGLNGLENLVDSIPLGARTIMIVAKPDGPGGGSLITFRRGPAARDWVAYSWLFAGTQYTWSDGAINISAITPVDYSSAPRLFEHVQNATNTLTVRVNGTTIVMSGSTTTNENSAAGFTIGGRAIGSYLQGWDGMIAEVMVWTRELTVIERAQARAYARTRYPSLPAVSLTSEGLSVVKAAKTGMVYRQLPGHYPQLRGN